MDARLMDTAFPFAKQALSMKHCDYTDHGIRQNLKIWGRNKTPLIELLRKSPHWDEEVLGIVMKSKYIPSNSEDEKRFTFSRVMSAVEDYLIKHEKVNDLHQDTWSYICSPWWFNGIFHKERLTDGDAEWIKSKLGYDRVQKGMKSSRLLQKLMRMWDEGIMEDPIVKSLYEKWTEALSEKTYECRFVLSANPADYLLMSNGNSWSSCHNIPEGEWSAGTLSYMGDKHSLISYIVDAETSKERIPIEPKIFRRVIFVHPDYPAFVGSRIYPVQNITSEDMFNNACMNALSDVFDVENSWAETENVNVYQDDDLHYADYGRTENCSYYVAESLPDADKSLHFDIYAGNTAYCLDCGEYELYDSEYLICPSCGGGSRTCEECGERVTEDDCIFTDFGCLCRDCGDLCHECGEGFSRDDMIWVITGTGRWGSEVHVCHGCYEDHYSSCANCGESYPHECMMSVEHGDDYCPDCFHASHSECEGCGEYFDDDDLEDGLCPECLSAAEEEQEGEAEELEVVSA